MYRKSVHTTHEEWSREARMVKVQKCSCNKSMAPQSHEEHKHQQQQVFWGQSTFECNFCKRQFRSAQALGGHMNVHRRERAKLANNYPLITTKPKSSPPPSDHDQQAKLPKVIKCCHIGHGSREVIMRKRAHNGLDLDLNLNMGFIRDHHQKEDLDLELRLGFAS